MERKTAPARDEPARQQWVAVLKQSVLRLLRARETGLLLAILGICVLLHLLSANFLTTGNMFVLSRQIALAAILAIGVTFVILTSGIDLSLGSVVALTSVALGGLLITLQLPMIAAIGVALAVGAVVGIVNGTLVIKTGVHSFVITLGMLGIARGIALGTTQGRTQSGFDSSFLTLGQGTLLGLPIPLVLAILLAVAAHVFLAYTATGRHIYFVGSNAEAAELSGIRVARLRLLVFTLCSMLAAFAAVLETSRLATAQPAAGQGYELLAIGAVIIGGGQLMGGVGTILGTVLGATLLGLVTNGLVLLGISTFWQQAVTGTVIILAVALNTYRQRQSR